jgi:hypothetical protein
MMKHWIRQWVGDLSPGCRRAVRLQSEAMDHPLTLRQRSGLWLHLRLCRWCRRYGRHLDFIRAAGRQQAEADRQAPAPQLSPEARERLRRRLAEAQKGDGQ